MDLPALPTHQYVPGRTARHADGTFDTIRARALTPTVSDTAASNLAWLYALRLLGAGFWWETHEVLEVVWMNAPPNTAEWHLVQGIIQLANAALKVEMGRQNAARRLCNMAEACLFATGGGKVMGLEAENVIAAIQALRGQVGGPVPHGISL